MKRITLMAAAGLIVSLAACRSDRPSPQRVPIEEAATPDATKVVSGKTSQDPWWASPEACRDSLTRDPPRRDPSRVRLGSWNVKYFPDGVHGEGKLGSGTDVAWLACGIARLNVDVLAVQEFKRTERAQRALEELLKHLREHTGAEWRFEFARCGSPVDSHVGLLWNTTRATALARRELEHTLGEARKCDDNWQPVLASHFRFSAGVELHFGVVHLVAGDDPRTVQVREQQRDAMRHVTRQLRSATAGRDLVLVGDWNTSGCGKDCESPKPPRQEIAELGEDLAREAKLRLLQPSLRCSDYYMNEAGLVDHFAVSSHMKLPSEARVMVDGYCLEERCEPGAPDSKSYEALSDHCPIVLDMPVSSAADRSPAHANREARKASPGERSAPARAADAPPK